MPRTPPSRPRRVAFMLKLEWPYKRHAGIFAGTNGYAKGIVFRDGWIYVEKEGVLQNTGRSFFSESSCS